MKVGIKIEQCNSQWRPCGLKMTNYIELTEGMTAAQLKTLVKNKLETERMESSLVVKLFSYKTELEDAHVLELNSNEKYTIKYTKNNG